MHSPVLFGLAEPVFVAVSSEVRRRLFAERILRLICLNESDHWSTHMEYLHSIVYNTASCSDWFKSHACRSERAWSHRLVCPAGVCVRGCWTRGSVCAAPKQQTTSASPAGAGAEPPQGALRSCSPAYTWTRSPAKIYKHQTITEHNPI